MKHPFSAVLDDCELAEMIRGVQKENCPWPFMVEFGEPIKMKGRGDETSREDAGEPG